MTAKIEELLKAQYQNVLDHLPIKYKIQERVIWSLLTKSTKDLIKNLKKGQKIQRKREDKEHKKRMKQFREGEKLRRKQNDAFFQRIEKGIIKREQQKILKNSSIIQKLKLKLIWALSNKSKKKLVKKAYYDSLYEKELLKKQYP